MTHPFLSEKALYLQEWYMPSMEARPREVPYRAKRVSAGREVRELVLVYIGSAECGPCCDPAYKALLKQAKDGLVEPAVQRHMRLRYIGVSTGWSVPEGVAFLAEAGYWHEIIVGNNWMNSGVTEYMWEVPGAETGIPQVVLLERVVRVETKRWAVLSKRYLLRLVGKQPLQQWVDAGLPLDRADGV
jgi:hypothetical protein